MPTADRDRLTAEAEKTLKKEVNAAIKEFFEKYQLPDVDAYVKSPFREMYHRCDFSWNRTTRDVISVMDAPVTIPPKTKLNNLYSILESDKDTLVCVQKFKGTELANIQNTYENARTFTTDDPQMAAVMKNVGVVMK
jgi:hypothetical protein